MRDAKIGDDMTKQISRLTAGLVFSSDREIDMTRSARHAAATLDSLGHKPSGLRILRDRTAQIATSRHVMRLRTRAETAPDQASRQPGICLELSLTASCAPLGTDPSGLSPDMVVTHVLKALHSLLHADHIRWVGDTRLMSRGDFDLITANLPRISTTAPRLDPGLPPLVTPPAPEATRQDLRDFLCRIDAEDNAPEAQQVIRPISDLQRLSAWLMTYAVVLLALPVGLALLLITVIKGENPRLASQTAALTGTFLAFQTYGTAAQAMSAVQSLLF
ncbi:hypothetical protein RAZWK3B_17848 [Roseobacter sp. AzwK-3b]|nr:hypothetical protein RAZWK3B_17848 [Roseobacter sp. AzwK-3b]